MTDRHRLSDEEWERLLPILKNTPGIYVVFPARCRQFVEAVLWILRTGSPWRQLSASGLKWNSVFRRFSRWSKHGVWQALLNTLAQEADLQNICIDSSVIRAHACAAGARASCEDDEALGRSRGGFGTKVHMAVDGLGLPLRFILSPDTDGACRQRLRCRCVPDMVGQQRYSGSDSAQDQPKRATRL